MPTDNLNEREFELINIVGAELGANQRDLSRHMDLSLGTINMLLRRLIAKGYIRTKQLNQRKVQYILTPEGFAEKMQKSVKYTIKTLSSISLIKDRIKKVIVPLYEKGERNFYILGESDLAVLIEMVFKEIHLDGYKIYHLKKLPQEFIEGVLLICKENIQENQYEARHHVDVITELAKDEALTNHNANGRG